MLIGLNGPKGSGKDTVGHYLVTEYGFTRLSFADKLKQSAAVLFGIKPEVWDVIKNENTAKIVLQTTLGRNDRNPDGSVMTYEYPVSGRYFLQLYGTEAHRNIFGDDFWVDALLRDYDPFDGQNYVITDARFSNELKRIKELNGFNISIRRRRDVPEDSHVSEAPPPPIYIDEWIDNNGSFNSLYRQVDTFMSAYPLFDGLLTKTSN